MFLGVEGGGEHAVCEEEGGKTASDLQSHDPRQAFGLEGPSEWLVKGLPTFIILIFMKQTNKSRDNSNPLQIEKFETSLKSYKEAK